MRARCLRAWAWMHAHPLVVVVVLAGVIGVVQGVWIWNHRLLGALDPDESGYVATAFRYHRTLATDPLALPRAIGGTGNGPLIPLLSVPLLVVGPHDVRTVLLMQPVLMVVTAVAAAGIARQLAGSGAAIVTGVVFATLPTVVFATQTYWLGLGAATFMALGIWALLASDRLTNRWTYAYGACIGAMLLCRTMTLGFLPAMLVAGLIVVGRQRASLLGLAKAVGVAVVVAGPWWFVARDPIFTYLFSYGYGERAGLFGQGGPLQRIEQRTNTMFGGVGPSLRWMLLVLAASAFMIWRHWSGWPKATRSAVAVAAASLLGIAALASTSNNGVWFELPIIALLVPLAIAAGAKAPVALRGVALVFVLGLGVLQLAYALWVIPPNADRSEHAALRVLAPGGARLPGVHSFQQTSQYEYGFAEYDPRFGPLRRDELSAAANDWWDLSTSVERYLAYLSGDQQTVFTISGSFEMFNSNTVGLAGELEGWTPRLWVPETVGSTADRAPFLTPTARDLDGNVVRNPAGDDVERVLVIALHDQHLFTPDAEVDMLYQEALEAGWSEEQTFSVPGGGSVVVLRHPDRPVPKP